MLYVDGAAQESYPFAPFLNKNPNEVLRLSLTEECHPNQEISNMVDFTKAMVHVFITSRIDPGIDFNHVSIPIGNVSTLDFNMSHDATLKLYLKGML
jgi:hypothetical protein